MRTSVARPLGPRVRLRVLGEQRGDLAPRVVVEMRQLDPYADDQVAPARVTSGLGQALAGYVDLLAILGVGSDSQLEAPGWCLNGNLRPADRLEKGRRNLRSEVRAIALEARIRTHVHR